MKLIKYFINGKVKPTEKQEEHCPNCNDGLIFTEEIHTKNREFESDQKEFMCGTCDTKYKIDKVPAMRITGPSCDGCPNQCGISCSVENENFLCQGSIPFLLANNMGDKMNKELVNRKEQFDKENTCGTESRPHCWTTTEPFRTSEGEFAITNCNICGKAVMDYKGKSYEDSLSNIITFLARNGIAHEKLLEQKPQGNIFRDLGMQQLPQQTANISQMFEIKMPSPVIDFGF